MSQNCIVILLIFNFFVFLTDNVKAINLKRRIISGIDGEIEKFPYLASVQVSGKDIWGASIISDRHLLTAAHCMKYLTEEYSVRVGSKYWNKDGLYIESIESVIIHPKYDKDNDDYDYAVIVLKEPLTFSSTINRIALPAKGEDVKTGETAVVAGWGTTNATDKSIVAPSFKYATLRIWTREDCIPLMPEGEVITERNFCTQDSNNNQNTCFGDSGGPLVSHGVLIGVVAWGFECAIEVPGVYSLVSAVIDFIEDVQKNSN